MKLIQLEILNLASLDKPGGEVINFTQGALGESNIFSIVGPTGSGKSTLLDAICLALYDRAPRYPRVARQRSNIEIYGTPDESERNRLAPTDCRNILTRGKNDGYSKLTFLANNGTTYRAEWHVRFNRTRYANTEKHLYKLSAAPDGTPQEELAEWGQLPQIIGLDYDQFLRTVLIAQGSFANFLTASEEDRFKLLEKLIGCEELYQNIVQAIKDRVNAANETYTQVSASVDAVKQNMLDEETLHNLEAEIKQLEQAEKALDVALKQIEKELQWFDKNKELSQAITDRQAKENEAQTELTTHAADFARLSLHDAIAPAVDLLREMKRLEQEIKKLDDNISATRRNITCQEDLVKAATKRINGMKESLVSAKEELAKSTPHIIKARELKTQIADATTTLTEKEADHRRAQKEANDAQKAMDANATGIQKAEQALAKAEQAQSKMKSIQEKERNDLQAHVDDIAAQLQGEQQKIQGQDADALQKARTQADHALQGLQEAITVVDNWDKAVKEKLDKEKKHALLQEQNKQLQEKLDKLDTESLSREIETLQRTYTLMTSEQWSGHRDLLHDGHPCPLCGATHHPYLEDSTQAEIVGSKLHVLLTNKESKLKKLLKLQSDLSGTIKINEGKISEQDKRLQQLAESINEFDGRWKRLHQLYPWLPRELAPLKALVPGHETAMENADNALSQYNKVKKRIDHLVKEKDKAAKVLADYMKDSTDRINEAMEKVNARKTSLAQLRALTDTLAKQLDDKQAAVATATAACQTARQKLDELQATFKQELNGEEPDEVQKRLDTNINNLNTSIEQLTGQLDKHNTELGRLHGIQTTLSQRLETNQNEQKGKKDALNGWLEEYNARPEKVKEVTMDDVTTMLTATDNWEDIRQTEKRLSEDLTRATTLLKQAKNEHEAHQASKPELTQETLAARQQELQQSSQQDKLIERRAQVKNHNDAVAQLGDRAQELETAERNKRDWGEINEAIGGDGRTLRKIAQCYTLRFLIEHANEEIRKFNSRYELQQVKNSLGIRVIDHDRADDVRDTTSLSGGETFIVSLGLALGLSSLSSRNISFDNLFIDEGFGTLDPDTLTTVIDSLAMLQMSQGKKVGVISHTDTMSERITTQICVVKNGSSGSSHIEIYP